MGNYLFKAKAKLKSSFQGDVLDDRQSLAEYSTDESIFCVEPSLVLAPKTEEDIELIIDVATECHLPLTARGGGTSTAGQCLGGGLIVDFSRHYGRILDVGKTTVTAQPGAVLEPINIELSKVGRRLAPDPSSRSSCTLGGMVSNNASGPHSFGLGDTKSHLEELKIMLFDGRIRSSKDLSKYSRYRRLEDRIRTLGQNVEAGYPRTRKNSSGYDLRSFFEEEVAWQEVFAGAEGTLGLITEVTMRTVPLPDQTTTLVQGFDEISQAIEALDELRKTGPVAIELIDHHILEALFTVDGQFAEKLGLSKAKASLWVEWEGEVPKDRMGDGMVLDSRAEQGFLWLLRSKASKALHDVSKNRKPLRCIEDGVVPEDRLSVYIEELREVLQRHDCDGAIFGHAGDAHLHVNPGIDVTAPRLEERIEALMEDAYELVLRHGGSISGEHGDGLLRRRYARRQWKDLLPVFSELRKTFDPGRIFNPQAKRFDELDYSPRLRDVRRIGKKPAPICMERAR